MIDKKEIIKILETVADPESGLDVIAARRIRDLKTTENSIQFTLSLPSINVPYKNQLYEACHLAVSNAFPEFNVHVHLSGIGKSGSSQILPQIKNVIAVGSGKGGVGKSTVSVNLALGLHHMGIKTGILDADLYGPSIPTMLGISGARPKVTQVHGMNKIIPLEAHGIPVMSIGFIVEPEQAVVLRGPRLSGIIKQFLKDCMWPELDVLIIDLPPGTGDIQLSIVQTVAVTGAVIVTTPQRVAVADAVKAANMFLLDSVNVPIIGVVENMSWFTPKELPENKYYIFGQGGGAKLAKYCKSALLGQLPLIQAVQESSDIGNPAVLQEIPEISEPFLQLSEKMLHQLHRRNETQAPTEIVQIKK